MRKRLVIRGLLLLGLASLVVSGLVEARRGTVADAQPSAPQRGTIPFPDARLKIEFNSTAGDAGLQVFLDAKPWREISITNPRGRRVVDVRAQDVIRNYGLTELFSESSEPPFDQFPFEEFKKLFPEGTYTFRGRTIEGEHLQSVFRLTHNVPDAPRVLKPAEDATLAPGEVVVEWAPVASPSGIDIVAYQVLVVADAPSSLGNPKRVLDVVLPATAARLPLPAEFLVPGAYKTEVLAVEAGGNQTLTEVAFTIQ